MRDQLNGFKLHVDQNKNTTQNLQLGIAFFFVTGVALLITATQIGREGGADIYCYCYGSGILFTAILFYCQLRGVRFVEYTDQGDHLLVRFGDWNTLNCCMTCCRGYGGGIGDAYRLQYDDIQNIDYEERTTCQDGCGANKNKAKDVVFSVGCCVPAVRVTTSNQYCCNSGVTKFGVDSREQATELVTFLESKQNAAIV